MKCRPLVSGWSVRPLMTSFPVLTAAALFSILFAAGCHRQTASSPDIIVVHEIAPQPARVGLTTIALGLTDPSSRPVTAAHITLEGDMSHPGMAPVFGEASEVAPGRYQGKLNFSMGGDWAVLVHITMPNGQKLERQFDVRGVEAN